MKPLLNSVPTLVSLLHPERNLPSAKNLTIGSEKILWWLGACGHEWESSLRLTALNPSCPYCSGIKALPNFNDLATTHPEIAKQWHLTKNGKLTAQSVTFGSSKKVWWQCDKGHEWLRSIGEETKSKGCAYCSGRKILPGFNDLATTHPKIASQWNYAKNNSLVPEDITHKNHQPVWWLGACGHEWKTSSYERTIRDSKCPICQNRKTLSGFNDLATTHPQVAKQWHPVKNDTLSLKQVTKASTEKAWWVCEKGHEWETKISSRFNSKNKSITQCPICVNQKVLPGYNDLLTLNPELAAQWHPTKNKNFQPQTFSVGSNKKVWWQCEKGHEWEATCGDRNYGYGCLKCSLIKNTSSQEKEIKNFLIEHQLSLDLNNRGVLLKKELDIYIPEKNIAIEFNGLYWHSEANGRNKYYHYDKWKACLDKGIQLIQIWEDDWNRNPALVKNMLAYKLGVTDKYKVFARKTVVKVLTQSQSNVFLNEYHIQGAVDGSIRVGLFETNRDIENLVAVMVLKHEPGTEGKTFNLLRYATSMKVVGGFTKLLKYVEREYIPDSIVTFSDNAVSDGGLYKNNGFQAVKELKPDYMYIVKHNRVHKFNYRLKRFQEDPALQYRDGLSERELAMLNNIPRIWDAGKTKWKKKIRYN